MNATFPVWHVARSSAGGSTLYYDINSLGLTDVFLGGVLWTNEELFIRKLIAPCYSSMLVQMSA